MKLKLVKGISLKFVDCDVHITIKNDQESDNILDASKNKINSDTHSSGSSKGLSINQGAESKE